MSITPFGIIDDQQVHSILLTSGPLSCQILTFGATIQSLTVPDRNGIPTDVVLGYDTLAGYLHHGSYLGATIGRYANRIARGRFQIDGTSYRLTPNMGLHHLHGGRRGFSHQIWDIEDLDRHCVTLVLHSPHGQEGYPGNMDCRATFTLDHDGLTIRYQATADRDTVCSLTNHSYFNLSGHGSGTIMDHRLQLLAQSYTPTGPGGVPRGTIAPVAGTPLDLRSLTTLGDILPSRYHQLRKAHGYDHNYVIDGPLGTLRPAALVHSPVTGITMEVHTTLPGMQFYTGNYLPRKLQGKRGSIYGPHHGLCLETQFFPDSPNHPSFPSPILRAGTAYDHCTCFRFSDP